MSALEKTYQTCLPPEAYIRIIQSCENANPPKFKSSIYPVKKLAKKKGAK